MSQPNEGRRHALAEESVDDWIDAMSAVLALPLESADRDQVRANLLVAHRMAASMQSFALDDREESLPVYRP